MKRSLFVGLALMLLTASCGSESSVTDFETATNAASGCTAFGAERDDSAVEVSGSTTDKNGREVCDGFDVSRVDPDISDDTVREIGCPGDPSEQDPAECGYQILTGLQIEPSPREFDYGQVVVEYDLTHQGGDADGYNTKECERLKSLGDDQVRCDGRHGNDSSVEFEIYVVIGGKWQPAGNARTDDAGAEEIVIGYAEHFSVLWLAALPEGAPLQLAEPAATQIRSDFTGPDDGLLRVALAFDGELQPSPSGQQEWLLSLTGADRSKAEIEAAFFNGTGVALEPTRAGALTMRSLDGEFAVTFERAVVHADDK